MRPTLQVTLDAHSALIALSSSNSFCRISRCMSIWEAISGSLLGEMDLLLLRGRGPSLAGQLPDSTVSGAGAEAAVTSFCASL